MKLNHDCVREVLLTIEEHVLPDSLTSPDKLMENENLRSFSFEEVNYTIAKLNEANFVNVHSRKILGTGEIFYVKSITWDGHAFLDNIRDNEPWSKAKKAVSHLSSVSLTILADVAKDVIKKSIGI